MWSVFVIIIFLSSIDHVYFTEGAGAEGLDDRFRKVAHLFILLAIVPVGYLGWKHHPVKWLKKAWLWSHMVSLSAIVGAGVVCYAFDYFDYDFLRKLREIRFFFCSPVPYFILYILSVISQNTPGVVNK